MAASYPSSIWSNSNITTGTLLEAVLFTDADAEIDAIETELGVEIMGTAGSLRERLNMFMDGAGEVPYYRIVDLASSGERKSLRAGTEIIETDDLTDDGNSGTYQVVFTNDDVEATQKSVDAFVAMQVVGSDPSDPTQPAFVNYVHNSGTTDRFDIRVASAQNLIPAAGTSFILHYICVERNFHANNEF